MITAENVVYKIQFKYYLLNFENCVAMVTIELTTILK